MPQTGDDTQLARYIRHMPGGRYIKEQWKSEPRRVVAVYSQFGTSPSPLREILTAYPPEWSQRTGSQYQMVLIVPEMVAELLEWNEENDWYGLRIPEGDRTLAATAQEVAQIWEKCPKYCADLNQLNILHKLVTKRAGEENLDRGALAETTLTLWEDAPELSRDDIVERAVTVLGR